MNGSWTYVLISIPFLLLAVVLWVCALYRLGIGGSDAAKAQARRRFAVTTGWTLVILLVLTAIFDNVIIAVGLVAYDDTQRVGLSLGLAPLEDFFYTVFVALSLPAAWVLSKGTSWQRS